MDDLYATSLPRDLTLSPHDCEVFQRVWQRVMPDDLEGCPVRPRTPQEVAEAARRCTPNLEGKKPCNPFLSISDDVNSIHSDPTADSFSNVPSPHITTPAPSPDPASVVQHFIVQALMTSGRYRTMATQTKGATSRTLTALANETHAQAKKLAALHFLYWGIQYWPNQLPPFPPLTYPSRLREQFCAQRRMAVAYIAAAHCCEDSDLHQLYLNLAQLSNDHAQQLRTLAEGL